MLVLTMSKSALFVLLHTHTYFCFSSLLFGTCTVLSQDRGLAIKIFFVVGVVL